MIHNDKFKYKKLDRQDLPTGRVYVVDGVPVPSVTTILSKTKDMSPIDDWRNRIGNHNADVIVKTSTTIGSVMHDRLENYLLKNNKPLGTNPYRVQAGQLADIMLEKGLDGKLDEFWGTEVPLHYDTLYAGTSDLIGIYEGEEAIIDFKNSRRPKKEEYIIDYKKQLVSYAEAHNFMYGTNIKKGVILMVSREKEYFGHFQKFILSGKEWDDAAQLWYQSIADFYELN